FARMTDAGADTYTVSGAEFDATFSDNVAGSSISNDFNNSASLAGAMLPVGANTIIWTVTDAAGNQSNCTSIINVSDNEAPVINCAVASQTQTADAGVCEADVAVVSPSVSDNTTVVSLINDYNGTSEASDTYPVGKTTVTWTATDASGNTSTCSQEVIVADDELPVVTCAGDVSITVISSANCSPGVVVPSPISSDNCGIGSVTNDFNGLSEASGIYPFGTTNVTWTVTDVHGNSSSCIQTVTVKSEPLAIADDLSIDEDQSVDIAVLDNDLDCDGNIVIQTLNIVASATNGSTTVNADGTITYLPDLNYYGTDYFTYQICDADGFCSEATVTIQVASVYDPPVGMGDINNTFSGIPTWGRVLTNDVYHEQEVVSGPSLVGESVTEVSRQFSLTASTDGQRLTASQKAKKVTDPLYGTLVFNQDGTYIYTPEVNYSGIDQFTYQIDDAISGLSNPITVYLRVISTDLNSSRPPIANSDVQLGYSNSVYPNTGNVLENDFDVEGHQLMVATTPVVEPAVGTLTLSADGTYTYDAPANYEGEVSFTYEVYRVDEPTVRSQADVVLVFFAAGQEDLLYGVDDAYHTDKNGVVTGNVSNNDINLLGSSVSIGMVIQPIYGTVTIDALGDFSYTPNADYVGPDNFTYSLCKPGSSFCRNATVYITVDETNRAPIAVDDDFMMHETTVSVLDNDSDPDGNQISVTTVISEPQNGVLAINPDGTFTYTPNQDYFGDDSFVYEVCDDFSSPMCDQATVILRRDSDNDGVPDSDDVDDDNDGILDIVEGMLLVNSDNDRFPNSLDIDSDNDGIPDNVEAQSEASYHAPLGTDTDGDGWDDAYDPDNGGTPIVLKDTDNDGYYDYVDIDTDNDGILDIVEGVIAYGGSLATPMLSGLDSDEDGLDDTFDTIVLGSSFLGVTYDGTNAAVENTDNDAVPDYRDIDSDNDGILDNIEAQEDLDNYVVASEQDQDGDGLDDAYDSDYNSVVIVMFDFDGDGIPDFRDEDTDGDTVDDYIEANDADMNGKPDLVFSGNDADGDGLDDVFDSLIIIEGPEISSTPGATTYNPGASRILPPIQDSDNDNKPDFRDVDDDNDLLATIDEDNVIVDGDPTNDDCNYNGIPNYLDPETCDLIIPDAFSPNADGYNDYLEILGLYKYPNAHLEVYTRWGARIYEKDNYGNVPLLGSEAWWDGRPNIGGNGDIVPEGTYFVILILENSSVYKGTVFINR
ncbi:tandem-95 repeat protein, partial [Mangrovibacterium sp.]|uniref:tandem-95 repeat protein n=1 Tax=Mangrovibacterium sp. TaxID=1961364 RepID=UPI003562725E